MQFVIVVMQLEGSRETCAVSLRINKYFLFKRKGCENLFQIKGISASEVKIYSSCMFSKCAARMTLGLVL
jgi:hypothetical protein